jgi:hypothetical protein
MDNKVIIQDVVIEVAMIRKTGRMFDWYGVKIRTADGSEVTVECEASELDKRLFPDMKITVLAYRTDKGEDGEPADRIVAKALNY